MPTLPALFGDDSNNEAAELEADWEELGLLWMDRDATGGRGDPDLAAELEADWEELGLLWMDRDATARLGDEPAALAREAVVTSETEERHGREEQEALLTWDYEGGAGPAADDDAGNT